MARTRTLLERERRRVVSLLYGGDNKLTEAEATAVCLLAVFGLDPADAVRAMRCTVEGLWETFDRAVEVLGRE